MFLKCPRCRAANEPDALFCKICGNAFAVKERRKNSLLPPLVITGSILAVCGFGGLFGLVTGNRKPSTPPLTTVKTLVGANTTENKASTNVSNVSPVDDEQMATVVTENVNLWKTNSAKSEVVETLLKDSVIEVVKQSGARFSVRHIGGQSGRLHGNAIRLKNAPSAPSVRSVAETSSAPRQTRPATTAPSINNSGAPAKYGDGAPELQRAPPRNLFASRRCRSLVLTDMQ